MTRNVLILISCILCSTAAQGDLLVTADGKTREGEISFQHNGIVRLTLEQGHHEVPLTKVHSLRITPPAPDQDPDSSTATLLATQITNRYVAIPGAGVLTWDGSFIATGITRIDETQITLKDPVSGLLLTRINTAAIFFHPLSHHHVNRLRDADQGLLFRNGDFIEGRTISLEGKEIRFVSLIFGLRRYSTDDAVAILLRKPTTGPASYTLQTQKGSRFLLPELLVDNTNIILNTSPFHNYRVPLEETVELVHRPGTNILRTVWARLDSATDHQRKELLERVEIPDLVKEAAEANLVRARNIWDEARRIWTNKNREYSNARNQYASAKRATESKQRQVDSYRRQIEKYKRDLESKSKKLQDTENALKSAKESLAQAGNDVKARSAAQRKVRDANRNRDNSNRSASQAKSRLKRAQDRLNSTLKSATETKAKADRLAKTEAEARTLLDKAQKETDTAKKAFDLAMSRLL